MFNAHACMQYQFAACLALLVLAPLAACLAGGVESSVPAARWEEAFLSGNGRMGIMVFGNPYDETVVVNHCRLYLPRGSREIVPDLGKLLPEMKAAGLEGGPSAVHAFLRQKAAEQGFKKIVHTDPFHPAFLLKLKSVGKGIRDYRMTQDFATGEVAVRWSDDRGGWERKLFVSRPDNVAVLSIVGPKGQVGCELGLEIAHDGVKAQIVASETRLACHAVYVQGKGGYDSVIRVVADGGTVEAGDGRIAVTDADGVLLLMRVEPWKAPLPADRSEAWATSPQNPDFGPGHKTNVIEDVAASLDKLPADYRKLLAPHAREHGALFGRVSLDLGGGNRTSSESLLAQAAREDRMPPALMETMYDACRYLMICSTGERVPNLQGIWTGTWKPAWSGDFTLDSNIQLEINSMLSANLPDLMMPYFDLVESWLPDCRTNARKLYGCRGILTNARASNTCLLIHWGRWPGELFTAGAGWLAHYFYDYYLFTGDKQFLAKRAVPLLKEVALFYEDLLEGTEGPDGKYRFFVSYSPELGITHPNATFDIAVAKETLTNLIAACKELGIEADRIPKWQAILAKMPPYLVGKDGALKEWSCEAAENGSNYNHRHYSFLYPIFQSYEFSPERTPDLWRASEIALEKKAEHWLHGKNSNSNHITHGMMNHAQCAARLGQGEVVHEILSRMATRQYLFKNFMTAYWPNRRGFGFDAVGTIPDVVNNSLIFGLPGRLEILPALPTAWPKGSIKGVLARGQLTIQKLTWDLRAGAVSLVLTSRKDQTVTMRLPKRLAVTAFTCRTGGTCAPSTLGRNARDVALKAGEAATIAISLAKPR